MLSPSDGTAYVNSIRPALAQCDARVRPQQPALETSASYEVTFGHRGQPVHIQEVEVPSSPALRQCVVEHLQTHALGWADGQLHMLRVRLHFAPWQAASPNAASSWPAGVSTDPNVMRVPSMIVVPMYPVAVPR
jgi:hypothetical protein